MYGLYELGKSQLLCVLSPIQLKEKKIIFIAQFLNSKKTLGYTFPQIE